MKIYLESYGCTLNKSEAGLYVNSLLSDGGEIVQDPAAADIRVIGTCVVIQHTEDRMLRRISNLKENGKVRVIGCLPSVAAGSLVDKDIEVLEKSEFKSFYSGKLDDIDIKEPSIFNGIPINQGCTGSCNFCISHISRGKLLSRPLEKIIGQIKIQLGKGVKEVRLSSLDSAAYGKDLSYRLDHLVDMVAKIEGDFRIRVGMMEPRNTSEILDPLMNAYQSGKVYKFLHLPVQSGDDRILDAMNREYHAEDFNNIVRKYRHRYPDSTLSTDIITGYYQDDEESFEKTVKLLMDTKPEIVNITRFSPRPYTADFNRKVPPSNLVKRWTSQITELHHSISAESMERQIGKIKNIMITEHGRNETSVGRDEAYRPVVIKDMKQLYSFHSCEVVEATNTYLIGKIA